MPGEKETARGEPKRETDELKKMIHELSDRAAELYKLYEFSRLLNVITDDAHRVFNTVKQFLLENFPKIDEYALFLFDKRFETLTVHSYYGLDDDIAKSVIVASGRGVTGSVAKLGLPSLVNDIDKEEKFLLRHKLGRGGGSFLCLPLNLSDGRTIGIITLHSFLVNELTERDARFFSLVAQEIATTLERVWLFQKTFEASIQDPLTLIYNRRYLDTQLRREVRRAARYGHSLSLVVVDIDNFKEFNDAYGHIAGDDALKKVASILARSVREYDVVARFGGDEFVILLPETTKDMALDVADRLRCEIAQEYFHNSRDEHSRLTISVGVINAPTDTSNYNELFPFADRVLYDAKHKGKNTVRQYADLLAAV
jgi:diguanylate cyclase (GGDEF)-like protein